MFGLPWGSDQAAVKVRLEGIAPVEEHPHVLIYPMEEIADRLWKENAFCPTALCSGPGRDGDQVVLNFLDGMLVAGSIRFGYGFEMIGQSTETLSEQAMAAFARCELQQMIFEMSSRYGPPVLFTESHMRSGRWFPVGAAMFDAGKIGMVHVLFGHDGGMLIGELRYQSPITDTNGL